MSTPFLDQWNKDHSKPSEVQIEEKENGYFQVGDDLRYGNTYMFTTSFGSQEKMIEFSKIMIDCLNFAGNPYTSQEDIDEMPGRIEAYVNQFNDEDNRSELELKYRECVWITNIKKKK